MQFLVNFTKHFFTLINQTTKLKHKFHGITDEKNTSNTLDQTFVV